MSNESTTVATSAEMGSTRRVYLDDGAMQNAINAISNYQTALTNSINSMSSSYEELMKDFSGDAAEGFKENYEEILKELNSVLRFLDAYGDESKGMFARIEQNFIGADGIDPYLGNQSKQYVSTIVGNETGSEA